MIKDLSAHKEIRDYKELRGIQAHKVIKDLSAHKEIRDYKEAKDLPEQERKVLLVQVVLKVLRVQQDRKGLWATGLSAIPSIVSGRQRCRTYLLAMVLSGSEGHHRHPRIYKPTGGGYPPLLALPATRCPPVALYHGPPTTQRDQEISHLWHACLVGYRTTMRG